MYCAAKFLLLRQIIGKGQFWQQKRCSFEELQSRVVDIFFTKVYLSSNGNYCLFGIMTMVLSHL